MYYVYVLLLKDRHFYIGLTNDIHRRYEEHRSGKSPFTSKFLPVKLLFYEAFAEREDALRREQYFKTTKGRTTLRLMMRATLKKHADVAELVYAQA